MSDTASSFANWSDDLYHYAPSPGLSIGAIDGGVVDSTIIASTAAPTSPASAGSGDASPNRSASGVLGPRAAGKPSAARKRARASRRAPVTMLNTDAANFRAMVQQFTGIPTPPAGPFSAGGARAINFGVPDYGFPPQQQQPAAVSFDHLHQRQQQYTGAAFGDYGNGTQQALSGGVFGHGLGSAEDRMFLQSLQAAQMLPGAHAANNGANGYFA
ncbi:hypothetical protein QYE76_036290 [Lolium multiflorum]|uniref:VQ domain-containing protein n=1 Tax=Lolium multiflorum TaxID=4521 RepID=A0AAD8VM04_LOLMU|nr:hypothetical protein QYE76_036290 [Lolium multiflorum]